MDFHNGKVAKNRKADTTERLGNQYAVLANILRNRHNQRGYGRLYVDHVLQADRGCDFDFLVGDELT